MRVARTGLGVIGAALLAASLAGCGTQRADAAVLVRDAPAKTESARTARMAMSVTSTSSNAPATAGSGEGVVDLTGKKMDVTIDPQVAGQSLKLRMLGIGYLVYIQVPDQLKAQTSGKSFVRIDMQAAAKQQGIDLAALADQRPDPDSQLSVLSGAGADFAKVGSEKLRGDSTTHYRGTVDLMKAAENKSDATKTAVTKLQQMLGTSTMPMDVWLDGKGRLRKMTYSVDLGKVSAAAGRAPMTGEMTETMELYDYGVRVNVVEPPADQVLDITALAAPTK